MARISTFGKAQYLNIDNTVGEDGVNQPGDVYLVQALLYELFLNRIGLSYGSPDATTKMALPTGIFNKETWDALNLYKEIVNNHYAILKQRQLFFEKHIDPIKGSIYAFGSRKLWALARMQFDLSECLSRSSGKYIDVNQYLLERYILLKLNLFKG